MLNNTAVIIPARLHSRRLPCKPLQMIGESTLIEHSLLIKKQLPCPLYLATDSHLIADIACMNAVVVVVTPELPSGTDRVCYAINQIDPERNIQYVINLQGDMPFVEPGLIEAMIHQLHRTDCDILTLARRGEYTDAQRLVKVVSDVHDRALYFSRSNIPFGARELLYHTGIYGFTRSALERFVSLGDSHLEKCEHLEQLRALEHGMRINLMYHDEEVVSVDTPADLERARKLWHQRYGSRY